MPGILGGAMIVAGTVLGAGMFSLPSVSSGMWFGYSLAVLFGTWLCMCHSGLLLMEANLHYAPGTSFDTMAKDCLPAPIRFVNSLSVAFVLYILTYAYVSGGGSIAVHTVNTLTGSVLPVKMGGFLFALILSLIVWLSTKTVDRVCTVMLGGMFLAFFLSVGDLMGNARSAVLFNIAEPEASYLPYVLATLPFFLTSFGYHGNVPGLVKYYHQNARKVTQTIVLGSFIGLVFYACWQFSVLGNIPRPDFIPIVQAGGNLGVLVSALSKYTSNAQFGYLLQVFSHFAVASSFLGVSLGLFDSIADTLGFDDSPLGRSKTALVTFVPPMVGGLLYPDGFTAAIGFAGLAATIFAVIVPALMVLATRRKYGKKGYRAPGGHIMLCVTMGYGFLVALCHISAMLGLLPVYGK